MNSHWNHGIDDLHKNETIWVLQTDWHLFDSYYEGTEVSGEMKPMSSF